MASPLYDVLGLPLEAALTLLKSYGICAPDVRFTQAPGDAPATGEARVVAVREDGHLLICGRFPTGDPAPRAE